MGTAIPLDEIKRFEVTEVYTHPDAKVDIVLVHGLNGHPRNTWTAKNGVFWPSQLLPVSLKSAQARVLTYGYNADVYTFGSGGKGGPSTDMIHQHAQTLLANLALERKSEERSDVPIIWVAHSLGGILVKRALELSHDLAGKSADDLRSIYVSSYGIIFLGTPHNGADPAKWGVILQGMVNALIPKKLLESQSQLIKTLQSNNETLQNINLKFLDIYPNHLQVCMVHESHATDLKGTKAMVVDQISAGPLLPDVTYFGIEATHSGMCKFESKNSPGWTNVSVTLKSWIQEAEPAVQRYWAGELMARRQKDESEMDKLKSKYQPSPGLTPQPTISAPNTPDPASSVDNSTIIVRPIMDIKPTQPTRPPSPTRSSEDEDALFFIKPSGFRPNSLFVGREAELAEMHKMLFDRRKRAEGTSTVLIQSIPGGGKTHLARQYVYEHKADFPGGIFWIRAKSQSELALGFWDIARKAALKRIVGTEEAELLNDPQQFIRMVKKWLNRRRDWLMVLDGIHFADTEAMRRFIPDSKNTSLIYTSTERSVVGDYHFMNPQIIRLPSLSAREAQRLLLLELDRREPFNKEDLRYSMELVQSMGFLPVVIHAVAQRLKSTNEPLSRFAKHYSSDPRLRGLGTFVAVVDQLKELGAVEALNLIYILCFFSQPIPVEMISLGLKALDVQVKALDPVLGRHLNNTFKILNMFALIDRNQPEATMQSSQSSKDSHELLAENIDVIRLHGVVQGFFIDTLAANHTLPMWLDRAIRVFCCSYDLANEKIMRKTSAGLVEDYRRFEIHGIKLREHLAKYIGKHWSLGHREILLEAQDMLWSRLEAIKAEIERRTPESSHVIAGGRAEAFQTSIFDRTSSSSDTGPETPAPQDQFHYSLSTWGLKPDMAQHESPSSLTYDTDYTKNIGAVYRSQFPLPIPDDPGYDSDREDSVPMTAQPSQRTLQLDETPWREVISRRQRLRAELPPLHRTIKTLEKSRYRDSAGAYRSMTAIDPRLSTETARGFLQGNNSRERSRGRISGQSSAEVALTHAHNTSPPPARGGGMIQDRRSSSQRPMSRGRMITGLSSYAAAVAGPTIEAYTGLETVVHPATEPASRVQDHPELDHKTSSAMLSLQRFPIESARSITPIPPSSLQPPYPQTPYLHPGSESVVQMPGNYSQENLNLGPTPFPSTIYPAMEGFPLEFNHTQASLPLTADHGVLPMQSGSLPSSILLSRPNEGPRDPLSISSPNIRYPASRQDSDKSPYYPGRPELPSQGGYSSQPMSRHLSGQSNHSVQSTGLLERRRRPSVAETEPMPQLPVFSPKIAPTSYQVYERMREKDILLGVGDRELEIESLRIERQKRVDAARSPRLGYARAALIERLEDWEKIPQSSVNRQTFKPNAPAFAPSQSNANSALNFTQSPTFPQAPANSMLSNSFPSTATASASQTGHPSPFDPASASFHTFPSPFPPVNTPNSFPSPRSRSDEGESGERAPRGTDLRGASGQGEAMERSESAGSGGVVVNRRLIEFGDYPEPVDYELARERVLRSWREREREAAERRKQGAGSRSAELMAVDSTKTGEGVGLGIGLDTGK